MVWIWDQMEVVGSGEVSACGSEVAGGFWGVSVAYWRMAW